MRKKLCMALNTVIGLPILLSISSVSDQNTPDNKKSTLEDYKQYSMPYINIAKSATPCVLSVRVEIGQATSSSYADNPFEQFNEELFERFFGNSPKQRPQPQGAAGSAFLISSDGYIMTNYHVVKDADRVFVSFAQKDGQQPEIKAEVVGVDPKTDLAVLKIEGENYPYLTFGDSDELDVLESIITVGSPLRLDCTFTTGKVCAIKRRSLQITQFDDFIQIDAPINSGSSGGALLSLKGEVVGVNTAIYSRSGGYMGIGFAIPSNMAKMVSEQIIANGSVTRSFLGVQLQNMSQELADAFNLQEASGALISEVVTDSPAGKAGLQAGDVITEFNGQKVSDAPELRILVAQKPAGSKCSICLLRNGKKIRKEIVLTTQQKETSKQGDSIDRLGLTVEPITQENSKLYGHKYSDESNGGLIVTDVRPNSIAGRAGISRGSLLIVANGKKLTSISDLEESLSSNHDKVLLLVSLKGMASFYSLPHPDNQKSQIR